jgi:hypothetical protein
MSPSKLIKETLEILLLYEELGCHLSIDRFLEAECLQIPREEF